MQQNAGIIADPGQQAAYGCRAQGGFYSRACSDGTDRDGQRWDRSGRAAMARLAGIKKGRRSVPFASHFEVGEVAFFL